MRKWKARLILLSFICGLLYFADERFDFFRMRALEIVPSGIIADKIIWEAVPKSAESYWFTLFFDSNFEKKIESYFPVQVDLSITGWGRYRVSLAPLKTFIYVSWNSKMWLLSKDGRMWPSNLRGTASIKGLSFPDKPILVWDPNLAIPIDTGGQSCDIYESGLPIAKITKWYEAIEKIGWSKYVHCLIAKKIDGRPVVQIVFGAEPGVTGELILKEDTSDWAALSAALKELYPNVPHHIPPGSVVNATYSDMKFTITDRKAAQ